MVYLIYMYTRKPFMYMYISVLTLWYTATVRPCSSIQTLIAGNRLIIEFPEETNRIKMFREVYIPLARRCHFAYQECYGNSEIKQLTHCSYCVYLTMLYFA